MRLLHAGHGHELRRPAASATPTRRSTTCKQAVSGNLCRCGTYPKVFEATLAAAKQSGTTAPGRERDPCQTKQPKPRKRRVGGRQVDRKNSRTSRKTSPSPAPPPPPRARPRRPGAARSERRLGPAARAGQGDVRGGHHRRRDEAGGALIGADEPPPLPPNGELKTVGKPTPRLDGRLKVTGAAKYTADIKLPGMLYGVMITSPHAARAHQVDRHSGRGEVPGRAARSTCWTSCVGVAEMTDGRGAGRSTPSSASPASRSRRRRDDAARRPTRPRAWSRSSTRSCPSSSTPTRPARPTPRSSSRARPSRPAPRAAAAGRPASRRRATSAARSNGGATRRRHRRRRSQDADVVVEATYRTQVQTHSAARDPRRRRRLEARPAHRLRLHAGHRDACATSWPRSSSCRRARSASSPSSWAAGSARSSAPATSASSPRTCRRRPARPVRLMLDRKEEHLSRRQPARARCRSVKHRRQEGRHARRDPLDQLRHRRRRHRRRRGGPAQSLYPCPAILTEEYDVFTHAGPAAAFRAPGHPQARLRVRAGDRRAGRQARHGSARAPRQDRLDDRQRRPPRRAEASAPRRSAGPTASPPARDAGPVKRGIGVAQSIWYRFMQPAIRTARSASRRTARSSCSPACRTSAAASAPRSRRSSPRSSASSRPTSRSRSATRTSRTAPARAAASRPTRSRPPRATPRAR